MYGFHTASIRLNSFNYYKHEKQVVSVFHKILNLIRECTDFMGEFCAFPEIHFTKQYILTNQRISFHTKEKHIPSIHHQNR